MIFQYTKQHCLLMFIIGGALSISACSKPQQVEETTDSAVQNEVQVTATNTKPTKTDYLNRPVKDEVFYYVMSDSFFDTLPYNDATKETSKFDYLDNLGISSIIVSPTVGNSAVEQSNSNNASKVGAYFSDDDDLKRLVNDAHARNIKVFFDIASKLSDDAIRDKDFYRELISHFKPDGFRVNTDTHLDLGFWQNFAQDITEYANAIGIPEFFIFSGKNEHNPATLSQLTTKGKLPSALDFGFLTNAREVIFKDKSINQLTTLFDNDDYYRDADSTPNDLLNFLSSHNTGHLGKLIQKGQTNATINQQIGLSKVAHALMYFSRGVPLVYFGDEQGLSTNEANKDNIDQSHPLYKELISLAQIKLENDALRSGEHINRLVYDEKRIYVFSRILPSDMVDHIVILNLSNKSQNISLRSGRSEYTKIAGPQDNLVELSGDQLMLSLTPYSYTILKSSDAIAKSMVSGIEFLPPYTQNDRTYLSFDVQFNDPEQFNLARIDVFGVTSTGETTKLAFDTTAPYRAIVTDELAEKFEKIKVVSDNYRGQNVTKTFDIPRF